MAATTLVATAGSASANTYCTRDDANTYHEDRVGQSVSGTTWGDASDDVKDKALLMATRSIDDLFIWAGAVVDFTQALLWPRAGLQYRSLDNVLTTVIPTDLRDATAEFARQLIKDPGRADDSDLEVKGIRRIKAGSVEMEFMGAQAQYVPTAVANMIPDTWYTGIRGQVASTMVLERV